MKYLKIIVLAIAFLFLLTGCETKENYLKNINFKELNEKLDNKEEFFFVVTQDGCSHCEEFLPVLKELLNENKIIGYDFNLTRLSESDKDSFYEMFDIEGTPTTIFIKDGKELSIMQRIVGGLDKDKLIQKFKNNGYIK